MKTLLTFVSICIISFASFIGISQFVFPVSVATPPSTPSVSNSSNSGSSQVVTPESLINRPYSIIHNDKHELIDINIIKNYANQRAQGSNGIVGIVGEPVLKVISDYHKAHTNVLASNEFDPNLRILEVSTDYPNGIDTRYGHLDKATEHVAYNAETDKTQILEVTVSYPTSAGKLQKKAS